MENFNLITSNCEVFFYHANIPHFYFLESNFCQFGVFLKPFLILTVQSLASVMEILYLVQKILFIKHLKTVAKPNKKLKIT